MLEARIFPFPNLIQLLFSNEVFVCSFSQRLEGVFDILARMNILCLTTDHERHVLTQRYHTVTTRNTQEIITSTIYNMTDRIVSDIQTYFENTSYIRRENQR